ncbi:hypothetical protein FQR65_LT20608 [Abscondita terminalis]|nr:hypothetical protein FQR65_LT20608 [Abscondita terminalis]
MPMPRAAHTVEAWRRESPSAPTSSALKTPSQPIDASTRAQATGQHRFQAHSPAPDVTIPTRPARQLARSRAAHVSGVLTTLDMPQARLQRRRPHLAPPLRTRLSMICTPPAQASAGTRHCMQPARMMLMRPARTNSSTRPAAQQRAHAGDQLLHGKACQVVVAPRPPAPDAVLRHHGREHRQARQPAARSGENIGHRCPNWPESVRPARPARIASSIKAMRSCFASFPHRDSRCSRPRRCAAPHGLPSTWMTHRSSPWPALQGDVLGTSRPRHAPSTKSNQMFWNPPAQQLPVFCHVARQRMRPHAAHIARRCRRPAAPRPAPARQLFTN